MGAFSFFEQWDSLRKGREALTPDLLLAAHLADARAKYQVREFGTVQNMIERILSAAQPQASHIPQRRDLVAGARVLKGQLLHDVGRPEELGAVLTPAIELLKDATPEPSRRSADLGIALMLLGRRAEATPYLKAAVQVGLPAWDAARWLGLALKEERHFADAEPLLSVATTCLPGFATVRLGWAETLERLGRVPEAVEQYRQAALATDDVDIVRKALDSALRLAPDDVDTLLLMAGFAGHHGHHEEALRFVDHVLEVDPNHPAGLATKASLIASTGDPTDALPLIDRAAALAPTDQTIRKLQLGVLERLGDHERMLKVLESAFEGTTDPEVLEMKASLQIRSGSWLEALKTTGEGLRSDPDSVPLLRLHVETLERLGAMSEAEKLVQEAAARHPGAPEFRLLEAEVLSRGPQPGNALRPLDAVLTSNPDHLEALLKKGELLSPRDPAEAERVLAHAVEKAPDSWEAHFHLGDVLRRLGRFDDARPHIAFALGKRPDDAVVIGTMAQVFQGLGQLSEAGALIERAVRKDPAFYWAWKCFFDVSSAQGKVGVFRQALNEALEAHATDARVLTVLGKTLLQCGDRQRARPVLERAVELAQTGPSPGGDPAGQDELIANAYAELGTLHRANGDADAAMRAYTQALNRVPDATAAISGKAWALLDLLKRPNDVRELLAPFVNQPAADPVLVGQYGEALRRLEWWKEADDALERAARQAPLDTWIGGYRSLLLTEIGRFSEAAEVAEAVAKAEPTAYIFGTLGWAWENVGRGEGEKARLAYTRGLDLDKGDPWCKKGLGNAYRLLQAMEKAEECYRGVLDGASREVERAAEYSLSMLGWCHYQLRHSHEAVRLFSSAVGISPNSISDWFDLGLALLSAGAESQASETYAQGLKLLAGVKHDGRRRGLAHIAINDLREACESRTLLPDGARTTGEAMIHRLSDFPFGAA